MLRSESNRYATANSCSRGSVARSGERTVRTLRPRLWTEASLIPIRRCPVPVPRSVHRKPNKVRQESSRRRCCSARHRARWDSRLGTNRTGPTQHHGDRAAGTDMGPGRHARARPRFDNGEDGKPSHRSRLLGPRRAFAAAFAFVGPHVRRRWRSSACGPARAVEIRAAASSWGATNKDVRDLASRALALSGVCRQIRSPRDLLLVSRVCPLSACVQ
ncbi:hypothetical protein C8Q80DRAFT_1205308 [Daedaleopsis nitida]|nr:hypothetical protein C8Q80DRAFT_1205308 [Daedaleopsis nitida]